jgi:hypothetical protein
MSLTTLTPDPNLTDIPFEVFTDFILPLIGLKEVGGLAMMCHSLKDFCDDNSVWRHLYLRTIRVKITDQSVHIGSKMDRYHHTPNDPCLTHRFIYPDYHHSNICTEDQARSFIRCLPCVPHDVIHGSGPRSTPVFRGWDKPLIHTCYVTDVRNNILENRREFGLKIQGVWQDHNRDLGLSTVNLCQNPDHYLTHTLDIPTSCRNLKSYKKAVLKKYITQEKKPLKSLTKKHTAKQKIITKARDYLNSLLTEASVMSDDIERRDRLLEKLHYATQ